jgi:hypothetical protein
MHTATNSLDQDVHFELRFASLFREGRGLVFPCDDRGQVDIDKLPARARTNYFCARTLIGREFATPRLLATAMR